LELIYEAIQACGVYLNDKESNAIAAWCDAQRGF
jgi:hypothetical protein